MLNRNSQLFVLAPLFLVLVIDTMGVGLIFPVLSPLFMEQSQGILPMGASLLERDLLYGLTLTLYFIFMFFGAPFFGDLSDHIGRKKVLLLCLGGTALGLALSAVAIAIHSVWILLFGRALAGFAAGSQSIAQAAIADISSSDDKVSNISFMILANCVGFILGPVVGGYFADHNIVSWFNFSTPFYVAAVLAVLNALGLQFTFKETFLPEKKANLHILRGLLVFIDGFKYPQIRRLSLVLLLMQIGWGLYFLYVTLFLVQHYHFDNIKIGHFMAYFGVVWGLALGFIIRIFTKLFQLRMVVLTSVVMMGGGMLMNLLPFEWLIWLSVWPIGIGSAMGYSSIVSLLSNGVGKNIQGWVMGVAGAVVAAAWGLGGVLAGLIEHISVFFPFEMAAISIFISGLLFSRYRPHSILESID